MLFRRKKSGSSSIQFFYFSPPVFSLVVSLIGFGVTGGRRKNAGRMQCKFAKKLPRRGGRKERRRSIIRCTLLAMLKARARLHLCACACGIQSSPPYSYTCTCPVRKIRAKRESCISETLFLNVRLSRFFSSSHISQTRAAHQHRLDQDASI